MSHRNESYPDWNRYLHAGGLIHSLLQHKLVVSGFVGLPQGDLSFGELTTAIIGELDELKIMQEGKGRTVLNGLQGAINSKPLRMLGGIGTFGKILSIHDAKISRKVLEHEVLAPPGYDFSRVCVKVVGYHASGTFGKYNPPQFKHDFAKFESYMGDEEPVSTIFLVPRNENVTPSEYDIADPLSFCIEMLERTVSNLR